MESVVTQPAQQAGFTLIELMIVIVIVAIFVTVGVPSFQNLVSDNRLSTQANRLVSSLQFARSEALKLRTSISVCRSTDGTTCVGAGGPWETGWIVFVDDNQNGATDATDGNGDTDAGETILQSIGAISGGNTLRGVGAVNNFVTYQANGLQDSAPAGGNFRLCDGNNPDTSKSREIRVTSTGRIQTQVSTTICP